MDILNNIINQIQAVNASRADGTTISQDETNAELLYILQQFDLEDDEDLLCDRFGLDGYHKIRDAEQGMY